MIFPPGEVLYTSSQRNYSTDPLSASGQKEWFLNNSSFIYTFIFILFFIHCKKNHNKKIKINKMNNFPFIKNLD